MNYTFSGIEAVNGFLLAGTILNLLLLIALMIGGEPNDRDTKIGAKILTFFMVFLFSFLVWNEGWTKSETCDCEKPKTQLVQPPNYDREQLLDLLEKGECVGGTIDEGKFSVFVCKE